MPINNNFKCKWAKCSNEKTLKWIIGYKNKIHIHATYKRFTSGIKTHINESEKIENNIPCKWEIKRKVGQ